MSPSSSRRPYAANTVARLTPIWRIIFRTEGIRSPGLNVPSSIRRRRRSATCRYKKSFCGSACLRDSIVTPPEFLNPPLLRYSYWNFPRIQRQEYQNCCEYRSGVLSLFASTQAPIIKTNERGTNSPVCSATTDQRTAMPQKKVQGERQCLWPRK